MNVRINPGTARGIMEAPPSKSMAHRLIICAGLAEGESVIANVDFSQDILATMDCLTALGATIDRAGPGILHIKGSDIRSGSRTSQKSILPCRECGSSLRFFIPLCLLNDKEKTLTGSETLLSRPLTIYEDICIDQGICYKKENTSLTVKGRLKGGDYLIPGDISSQFVSGLLFALPLLDRDSRIRLIPPVESRPYIDMTLQALSEFGVKADWEDDYTILVYGRQNYSPRQVRVEGDYSNAAFFEALNLTGGDVRLEGLKIDSLQGDKIYRKYFDQIQSGYADIDIADCPDLGPVLIAAAAMKHGAEITGTRRLRIKESDRGQAMKQELEKLGIDLVIKDNAIIVPDLKSDNSSGMKEDDSSDVKRDNSSGMKQDVLSARESDVSSYEMQDIVSGADHNILSDNDLNVSEETGEPNGLITLKGHNDHRIVMALAVLLTRTGGILEGAEAVNKSLPDFFERMRRLGIGVEIYDELDK